MDPEILLQKSREILDPILQKYNFIFQMEGSGKSSGGTFAYASYVKGDRKLELHFRFSLGLVTYHINKYKLPHDIYMKFLGVHNKSLYPGFSNEPLDGFRHLKHDLENFCSDFLIGDGRKFKDFAKEYNNDPNKFKGFSNLE